MVFKKSNPVSIPTDRYMSIELEETHGLLTRHLQILHVACDASRVKTG